MKRHLYNCDESAVTAHVMLAMMNVYWFVPECAAGKKFSVGPRGYKTFSCSIQLSMEIKLLIHV